MAILHSPCLTTRLIAILLATVALLAPVPIRSQVTSATLQGFVRDPNGHPISDARVDLNLKDETQPLTVQTNLQGAYRFPSVPEGIYTLSANKPGFGSATFGPVTVGQEETQKIDLTLEPKTTSSIPARPEFFDEPQFTVAGVTDAANPGGHGSDITMRTTDTLAKETVSLGNLATNPASASDSHPMDTTAEAPLREAAERVPASFDANYRLGKFLAENGQPDAALTSLQRALKLKPGDYEASYELALAYRNAGQYAGAQTDLKALLASPSVSPAAQAQLHHLLGSVEEKLGNPLEAVKGYQRAAELDPSEPYLFDWGAELLLHRALEPALEVFTQGNRRFPQSARMLVGLGVALYAHGSYDQAAQHLCEASDLRPNDPNPYLVMGKIQSVESTQPDAVVERLARFARLQPENAMANYYYASSLWRRRSGPQDAATASQVRPLLEKAIRLDPRLGSAYLQLGILFADQDNFPGAIANYQKAIAVSPSLGEAHYRLAQAYRRTGESSKAQEELRLYEQASKKNSEETERERHEIQQFVYTLQGEAPPSKPQ